MMLGLIVLVLVSVSAYLLLGPLPRIRPAQFKYLPRVKVRRIIKSTQVFSNSDVLVMLWILHTDLLSGQTLQSSISRSMSRTPSQVFPLTKAAVVDQTDVVHALRTDAEEIDNQLFSDLLQVIRMTSVTGAPAQAAIMRLIERVQIEQRNAQLIASELAGTRATVLVLAFLPVLGVVMSAGLGINSFGWLLGNHAGWACLVTGFLLEILGLAWVRLLINRATGASA